ncbi:hypothetical protein Bca52824_062676 [Brassica carinata]|uniref:NB-ARC domain-containing protein n=1 Tax=Brassica carinata TaxID=52824 RepID=A0A8X7QD53_BRACI|nr:hypothetical protein Bca52824_062676 [Brassica carinata]
MGDTNPVEVSCLDTNKAWELFKEKVGESILGSHIGIPKLARKVAEKCHGLPLALNVLGETMSSKDTIQEWRHASRENAFDEGYSIISSLLRACLLLEEPVYKVQVKMHDVVREMALWVASDLGEHEGRYTVQAGVGLREIPEVESWVPVRKISLMDNEIKELSGSPCCPELTTLLLQENKLLIQCIASENVIGCLEIPWLVRHTNRATACWFTGVMLICLNLESTLRLDNVSGISKFSRLRRLGLRNSYTKLDMSLLEELQLLKYLQVVTIGINSCLVAEKLSNYDRVVKCVKKLDYNDLQDESFRVLTLPTMDNLCDLEIEKCGMVEIKAEGAATSLWNRSPTSPSFLNLSTVGINYCNRLKDLTWLLFAPNLTILNVGHSNQIEYIISQEKATNGIAVAGCPNLRKLPLDSKSVATVEGFVIESPHSYWKENIEWEDEATKLRFQASWSPFRIGR